MRHNRAGVLKKISAARGRPLGAEAAGRMCSFIDMVKEWGEKIHLVGRENIEENIETQAVDSALMLKALEKEIAGGEGSEREGRVPDGFRVADIGSGAGFPGMVWKILSPAIDIVLFERKIKQALFLERAARMLKAEGVKVSGSDAADYTGEKFDAVCSKASGNLETMMPLAERMLKTGGLYLTIKGRGWPGERERVGPLEGKSIFEIPLDMKRGVAVVFKKQD